MSFTEKEILEELDLAWQGIPSDNFPLNEKEYNIQYNFFLDLEHGYCDTASSKIHLYANESYWAIVFEKCGYFSKGYRSDVELDYIGNCIKYIIEKFENTYVSNSNHIPLITSEEYERIRNKEGAGLEDFELISPATKEIVIHNQKVLFENDVTKYISLGIHPRDFDNPNNLIGFDNIVRYYSETNPSLVSATEQEIKQGLQYDIPRLMTLDKFHFTSVYEQEELPNQQELYQQMAKILVTKDISYWQPSLPPNNHWSNWESGYL